MKKRIISTALALCLLITALPLSASAAKIDSLTDVPSNQWYYNAVSYCLEHGYMDGVGNNQFSPKGTVNRAQIAQVLWNRESKPAVAGLSNPFHDVPSTWYHDSVIWCADKGIVSGKGGGRFAPTDKVTRQDVCVMVYRYFKDYLQKPAGGTPYSGMVSKYTDMVGESHYAKDALCWADKVGFMSGKGNGRMDPGGTCIRAELAQFLKNLDKVLGTDEPVAPQKCEHGNDPATCPICNNADVPQGLYNPKPSQSTIDSILSTTYYDGFSAIDVFTIASRDMQTEEFRQAFINEPASVDTANVVYMVDDPEYGLFYDDTVYATLTQGADHYNNISMKSIPVGGYTENGHVYNKYGQDVTSVDGRMTDFEANIYRALSFREFAMNANYYNDHSHESNSYFKECVQAAAEDRLVQVLENIENYAKAGCPEKPSETRYVSRVWDGTMDTAYIGLEPTWSRRLVELSKQYTRESDLVKKFQDEYKMAKYGTTQLGSTMSIDWDYGAKTAVRDWIDETSKMGKYVLAKRLVTDEIVVHLDESVRNSYGISPTDIASAAAAMVGGSTIILGGDDSFWHPATGVAYDAASGTCVILTAEWVLV